MAPGSNKRKRSDRQTSQDEGPGRPSPHRPENLGMAQHEQRGSGPRGRGGGGRRGSRQNNTGSPVANRSLDAGNSASPAPQLARPASRETPAGEGSRPVTPFQTTNEPSQSAADEEKKSSPAPYWYEHAIDEKVESWQDGGRESIQGAGKDGGLDTVSSIVQELVRSALDNRIDASEAGNVVRQLIVDHQQSAGFDVQDLVLSCISLLDESDAKHPSLLRFVAATEIDPEVIRQELDIPLLQTLGLVRSTFTQMRTRKTTNILYRQANFNLLREETEGYAKLITEYFNTANEAVHNHDVSAEAAFQRIKALVGSFDLDVGRVLDITLDISANLLVRAYGFFVKFYRCSSWWPEGGVLDDVRWADPGFGSFPRWALPESERPKIGVEEEKERRLLEDQEVAAMKEARDTKFWDDVRAKGMDAFFSLGARTILDFETVLPLLESEAQPEYDSRQKEINPDRRKRINENRKYMKETGCIPPPGNSDAAQLLGFKLRFYASDARDAQDTLPENLIYLAALLIKIGFISLRDLYPHLYPDDEAMAAEKNRLEKEKAEKEAKERPGGGLNALAMAGALTDDTLPATVRTLRDKGASGGSTPKPDKKDEEAKEELPMPSNQKIMLLKALLLIGALPEALYIIGRFPWLMEVDPSLSPYLHRILRHMLSKVAASLRPLGDRSDTQQSTGELESLLVPANGQLLFRSRDSKKVTRWLGLDTVDKTDGQMYRHYFLDWEYNIPVCQSIEDVFLLCNTFLGLLGVKVGQDSSVYSTLLRVANRSLTVDDSQPNRDRWLDLMRRLLVPALSLSKHNVGITDEVFQLLKFFPTTTRFNIYAEWYTGKTSRLPDMRVALDHNKAEVKEVLRRVTNETGKKQARALAKVSLSSPGVVTMSMIGQLESYSNMIPSLVECTRYFSALGYDVLTWCLINSLSGQGKDRMQEDGMLTSPWLQYLSQFVASLFFKYNFINPSPVLQYLAHQLKLKDSTDLEMFDQVLAEMTGIRSDMMFNDTQVLAMAGGEQLQALFLPKLGDKRNERKPSAQRLIKALAAPGLIGQTLISIAQERQMYAYHEGSRFMPLKVLGSNLDKIQAVFAQYLEVLTVNLKTEDFEAAVPDVTALIGRFGLWPGIAFTICRAAIAHRLNEHSEKAEADKKRRLSQEKKKSNGDVDMQDTEGQTATIPNGDQATSEAADIMAAVEVGSDEEKLGTTPQPTERESQTKQSPWHPILEPIIQALPVASPELADRVSVPFFVTFWTMTLSDIYVPMSQYQSEAAKLLAQGRMLQNDRSNMSTVAVKDRERKKMELEKLGQKLHDDSTACINVHQRSLRRFKNNEKLHYFSHSTAKSEIDSRHIGLLQECFLPRAMLSALDAQYCFAMLKMMHTHCTFGFSTMHLIQQLMKKQELAALMFQCTATEAQHFGRFLCEVLKMLQSWHSDKAVYEREALGLTDAVNPNKPGFAKKLDVNGQPEVYLDYEDFRRLLFNWHSYLSGALQMCFESGEYMHIRNGIIVLRSISSVFPVLNFQGANLTKHVTTLSKHEDRQDLKLMAVSLLGPLKHREKEWMMPQAFRLNDPSKDGTKSGSRQPSARPETPQPATGTPRLNATAPEFKPTTSSGLTNGTNRKISVAGIEDGEIDDDKADENGADMAMKSEAPEPKAEEVEEAKADKAPPTSQETGEVAPKPSTPAALPVKPASSDRPSSGRPASTQPGPRPPHDLPSRPESRPATRIAPGPPNERMSGRYPPRNEDRYGRLDRPNDLRPGSRGQSPGRSRPRTPERDAYYDTQAPNRGPRRDDRAPVRPPPTDVRQFHEDGRTLSRREQQSQPPLNSRSSYDARDRPNGGMAPPASHSTHPDRAGYLGSSASVPSGSNSGTAVSQKQDSEGQSQHHENPARLAMINDDQSQGRSRSKDLRPDERGGNDRDGGRIGVQESSRDQPSRMGPPTDLAPTGPRRGRLSRDLGSQGPQESSYGRLNASQDVPSGPRPMPNGPASRGGRGFAAPQAPASNRPSETPPSPSPSIARANESPMAPRGPAARSQPDRRSSDAQFEQTPASSSLQSSPVSENGPAVHPSRRAQLEGQPPPIQTTLGNRSTRSTASPASAAPSGPRGSHRVSLGAPTAPSPTTAAPPSGPASAVDRQRRGDRQRADINATLQGTGNGPVPQNQSGVSFRGAAQNRPPTAPVPPAPASQPVQAIASSMEPGARRAEPTGPSTRSDSRQEPSRGYNGRHEDRTSRHYNDAPGDKQRGSRNSSRERRAYEEQPRGAPPSSGEDRSMRPYERRPHDERDVRGGLPPRDSRAARTDDSRRPPDMPGSYSSGPPPPSWGRGSDVRGNREAPPSDGRRDDRGATRPEDYRSGRRDDVGRVALLPRDDVPGGRKRRHEDVPAYDETKRRRSGR